jgi:hypothetical protein
MKHTPKVRIGKMRVRVPGASKEAGNRLAQRLTEQLGHLPAGSAGAHIGALRLRIPGGPGRDASGISDAIAAAISSKLTRTQSHPHA